MCQHWPQPHKGTTTGEPGPHHHQTMSFPSCWPHVHTHTHGYKRSRTLRNLPAQAWVTLSHEIPYASPMAGIACLPGVSHPLGHQDWGICMASRAEREDLIPFPMLIDTQTPLPEPLRGTLRPHQLISSSHTPNNCLRGTKIPGTR